MLSHCLTAQRKPWNLHWFLTSLALVSFDLHSRPRCGQVQGKLVKSPASEMLYTNNPSWKERSSKESEISNNFFEVPVAMQSPNRSDLRRFMWSEMDHTVDSLMRGIAHGAHAMKQMVLPSRNQFKTSYRYLPAASTITRHVTRSPVKSTRIIRPSGIFNHPSPQFNWLVSPTSSNFVPIGDQSNYKILEELALQEWQKIQKANNSNQLNFSLGLTDLNTPDSVEEWKPIPITSHRPMSALHTNALPFLQQTTNDSGPYDVVEHIAEESMQAPSKHNESEHYVDIKTQAKLQPDVKVQVNLTQRRKLGISSSHEKESKYKTDQSVTRNDQIERKSLKSMKTAMAPAISPKIPSQNSKPRGELKFGDKLH